MLFLPLLRSLFNESEPNPLATLVVGIELDVFDLLFWLLIESKEIKSRIEEGGTVFEKEGSGFKKVRCCRRGRESSKVPKS